MTWIGWLAIGTPIMLLVAVGIGKTLKLLDDDTPCTPPDGDDDHWPFSDDTIGF